MYFFRGHLQMHALIVARLCTTLSDAKSMTLVAKALQGLAFSFQGTAAAG
jgi:hypothetical protein